MKSQMLYKELAKYYDSIYFWKDYKKESKKIRAWISKYKKSGGKELLDVACGTGKHLQFLKNNFKCIGIDISKDMLKAAKSKVKGVSFRQGDMTGFNLNKKFDAILCLFSSIVHLKNYANLRKAVDNMFRHLKAGGVLILESFIEKSDFIEGHVHLSSFDGKDVKIARIGTSKLSKKGAMIWNTHYSSEKTAK